MWAIGESLVAQSRWVCTTLPLGGFHILHSLSIMYSLFIIIHYYQLYLINYCYLIIDFIISYIDIVILRLAHSAES